MKRKEKIETGVDVAIAIAWFAFFAAVALL